MKKLGFVAVMLMVGVTVAFASSVSVPWFIDTTPPQTAMNPDNNQWSGFVYLKNNSSEDTLCWISYNQQDGRFIGPYIEKGEQTTFVIPANSTMLFRPGVSDPIDQLRGQEGLDTGMLVPNRPRDTVADPLNDGKGNGSLTIRFEGGPTTVQGELHQIFKPNGAAQLVMSQYLLPPGG